MIRTILTPNSKQITVPIPEKYVGTELEVIVFPVKDTASDSISLQKTPVKVLKNQSAIVTILDDEIVESKNKAYLQFAGTLSDENYKEIASILEATERTDENEW